MITHPSMCIPFSTILVEVPHESRKGFETMKLVLPLVRFSTYYKSNSNMVDL